MIKEGKKRFVAQMQATWGKGREEEETKMGGKGREKKEGVCVSLCGGSGR